MVPRNNKNSQLLVQSLTVACVLLLITTLILGSQLLILARFAPATDNGLKNLIASEFLYSAPSEDKYREGQFKGLVDSLEDPYSEYVTKSDKDKLNDSLNRRYEGVGIQFDFQSTDIKVVKTIPGSPAEAADVRAGDILAKVDDTDVRSLKDEEILNKIRGIEGSMVKLEFNRSGEVVIKDLKRAKILTELITLEVRDNVGIIKINSFGENLDSRMQVIASSIKSNPNIKNLIIDVRDDGGGLLNEAIEVISYFLPANTLILKEKSKSSMTEQFSKPKTVSLLAYPLQILVNGNTASASEILAGALRDQRSIKLVGQKTFGKGVVQKLFPLINGDSIKLTTAEWLTPNGSQINKKGLEPDIAVDSDKDALEVAITNFGLL